MCSPGKALWEGTGIFRKIQPLTERVFVMEIEAPEIARAASPGQFVLLSAGRSDSLDPYLQRPLGIAGVEGNRIVLLVQRVGRGTEMLQGELPGGECILRGPLGQGFPEPRKERSYLLAAGGVGVVPLLFAWERWGFHSSMEMLLGVPDASWAPLAAWVRERVPSLRVVSDDGTLGEQGNPCLCAGTCWDEVWACGPLPMLRGFAECLPEGTVYRPSMEARMGCGYGGCLGCVIPTRSGNIRACVEGPVMDGKEVLWHELGE